MSKAAPWEDDAETDARAAAAPWERDAEVAARGARVRLPRLPNGKVDQNSPEFKATVAINAADTAREVDPLASMNWGEKALANVGAGMSSIIDAAKQRLGTSGAPTDADVRETRRLDDQLAEGTRGGKVLQVAGQAAPLLPLGLIPGMQGVIGGAALGAAGGALQTTTDDESALTNTLVGGAVGGALPAAGKVLKAAWGRVGGAGRKAAGEALAGELAPEAAAPVAGGRLARAAEAVKDWASLRNEAGGFNTSGATKSERQRIAEELADQLRGVQPTDIAGVRVPVSSGAAIDNAALTRLEQGARNNRAQNWAPFKRSQAEAVADALRASTGSADELGALKAARSDAWEKGMADAMQNADTFEFGAQAAKFRDKLAAHAQSPIGQRQGVRPFLNEAEAAMDAAGDAYSPAHMLEFRTGIGQGFSSPGGRLTAKDAGLKAVRGDIDEALDAATGGKVTPVIQAFRDASPAVKAAEAAGNVRGAFFDEAGRPLTNVSHGDTPTITEARLRKFIGDQARPQRFGGGSNLAPQTEQELQSLLSVIRRNKNVEQLNAVAAPGGSATMANQAAMAADKFGNKAMRGAVEMKLGPLGKVATSAWDIMVNGTQAQREAIMDRALQDPQLLAQLMEQHAKSLGPTRGADALLATLRQGGAAGGVDLTR